QCGNIEQPMKAQDRLEMIGQVAGMTFLQEPHALLGERQWQKARVSLGPHGRRYSISRGRSSFDEGGQFRDRVPFEQLGNWRRHTKFFFYTPRQLRESQRMKSAIQ